VTTVEALASWASRLSLAGVPERVRARCSAQRASVLAAVGASLDDDATARVTSAVSAWAGDGPAPLVGTVRRVTVEDALFAAAAGSAALDFDDYLCFAHTGHSAVLVPLLLACETGSSGDEQLVAQVVANEVEARLGGACLIGPQNGQLWSFVHAAGAALAAGRLLGLGEERLAHALALSLYQPPRATAPGFMAPDSKLLTAAEPAVAGVRAARLAAAGVTGPLDALDDAHGFFSAFAYAPLRGMLPAGLDDAWATDTLCVKPHPGCAYLDTLLDALIELGPPPATDVESVTVEASVLTCQMDAMSSAYASVSRGGVPTPVTVTFSVPWNVAILLVAGELTPRQLRPAWLAQHHGELRDLAGRVSLRHDWALTRSAAESFGRLLPPVTLARDAGTRALGRGLRSVRADHPSIVSGAGDLRGIAALVRPDPRARHLVRGGRYWDPAAVDGFATTFPARVTVRLRDGRTMTAQCDVPRGGAGHPSDPPESVAERKLAAWPSPLAEALAARH
jgi:2-methylcitrate dehydratase PrpD